MPFLDYANMYLQAHDNKDIVHAAWRPVVAHNHLSRCSAPIYLLHDMPAESIWSLHVCLLRGRQKRERMLDHLGTAGVIGW